jgi:CpeT/CpcT family (DUF1001)/Oxidoreductase molybdopterin binding domain
MKRRMKRHSVLVRFGGLGVLLALALPARWSASAGPGSGSVAEAVTWLEGSFDSKAQASADRDFREAVFVSVKVPKSRLSAGTPVLYVEEADALSPERPVLQRFYRAEDDDSGRVLLRAFEPRDPIAVRGKWRDPSDLAVVGPQDVRERPGCAITLGKTGDHYEGWTNGTSCPSARDGARYATLSIWMWPDRVEKLDRGWDVSGKQVWGSRKGAVVFRRKAGGGGAMPTAEPGSGPATKAVPLPPPGPPFPQPIPTRAAPVAAATTQPVVVLIGVGARAELSASVLRTLVPSLADVKAGGATYRGIGLGDVLLKSGLRAAAMEDKRELAPSVVVATGSDGYTAVFSVAELLAPGATILLAFERDGKPLGPESGPLQIVDTATPTRSVRNLASLELRTLAANTHDEPAR